MPPQPDLKRLAMKRFGNLSPAEAKLFAAAPKGDVAVCSQPENADNSANDPEHGASWGEESTIRAELIRWLCIDPAASTLVDRRGIQVKCAKIVGKLDLSHANKLSFPLEVEASFFAEDADLHQATIPELSLSGSWTQSLDMQSLQVSGGVRLKSGFSANGCVDLNSASIGSNLACSGGSFKNPNGNALSADGANIKGDVFLCNGFTAEGTVRLLGANIGGNFECSGGSFKNPNGDALSADGANIKGDVFLCNGFTAEGTVRLLGATIGGDLTCSGGSFKNPKGNALSADRANIKGSVFLKDGFSAEGTIRLLGATIGGNLTCSRGSFKNPNGNALSADRATIKGNVFLKDGFSAEGQVRLLGATIGGDLSCIRGTFKSLANTALIAHGAKIAGAVLLREKFIVTGGMDFSFASMADFECLDRQIDTLTLQAATVHSRFVWKNFRPSEESQKQASSPASTDGIDVDLDLRGAKIGAIYDDQNSWPVKGKLHLNGCTYARIAEGPIDAQRRIDWLKREKDFSSNAYKQLAKVLRESGDDRGARQVLIAMEKRKRSNDKTRSLKAHIWDPIIGITISYGYEPWQVWKCLLCLFILGSAFAGFGYFGGAMAPTDKEAYVQFVKSGTVPEHYPDFNPFYYSLEESFPLINLGSTSHWGPNYGNTDVVPKLNSPALERLRNVTYHNTYPFQWRSPGILRFWLLTQVISGWGLATLFVAGISGIVQKE